MSDKSATLKWVTGLVVSVLLAIGGWSWGAVQATRASFVDQQAQEIARLSNYAVSNDKRITTLEANYASISAGISDLKSMFQKHLDTNGSR